MFVVDFEQVQLAKMETSEMSLFSQSLLTINYWKIYQFVCWTCSKISDTIVHFKKTEKKFFVNNFCVPELKKSKFLIQEETMVTQISAAASSPNFDSRKSYFKKITVFTF